MTPKELVDYGFCFCLMCHHSMFNKKNVLVRSFFKILFPTFISNTPQNGSTLPSQFTYKLQYEVVCHAKAHVFNIKIM